MPEISIYAFIQGYKMCLSWLTIPQPTVKRTARSIGYEPAWQFASILVIILY